MQSELYQRPALGQPGLLGSLYDSRTDTFLSDGDTIWRQTPTEGIEVVELNEAVTTTGENDSFKEKFDKMNICSELSATVLANPGNLQGCGQYLNQRPAAYPKVHKALHYSLRTSIQKLDFFDDLVKQCVETGHLERPEPTHVVSEVVWGTSCTISITRRILGNENRNDANAALEDAFKVFDSDEAGGASRPTPPPAVRHFSGQISARGRTEDQVFDIQLYGDAETAPRNPISTLAEAKSHLANLPNLLETVNGGAGVPISYSLVPVGLLRMVHKIPVTITIGQPSSESLARLVETLDDINTACEDLHDYNAYLKQNQYYIQPSHASEVEESIQQAESDVSALMGNYAVCLQAIRHGNSTSQDLWQLLDQINSGHTSPTALKSLAWSVKDKVEFIHTAISHGVDYIGFNGASLDDFFRSHSRGTVYIMYYNTQSMADKEEWDSSWKFFLDLLRKQKYPAAIVDADVTGKQIAATVIAQYENGNLVTEDVAEQEKALAKSSRIFYDTRCLESVDNIPAQRRAVVMGCPGSQCDWTTKRHWVCFSCQSQAEFSTLDKCFYCECGRVRFDETTFKCCDSRHGDEPTKPNAPDLYRRLKHMDPPTELNILILGETGVGKSTFINAFINYLSYDTLDDALSTPDLNWVIPCAFQTQTRDNASNAFVKRNILIGNDENEHAGLKGRSATQQATTYAIYVKGQLIRLIDTPGMGDTQGPEQDKKNMRDVISVLRSYDNIHGIIMLLKPTQSRINVMFRFVIQELLSSLHQSAARNIAYAFTNTRGTNYAPGDSYGTLEEQLKSFAGILAPLSQSNVYCFDSESFRYLAAKKTADIELGDIEDYRRSWQKSATESQNLRNYFQRLPPHPVRHTVGLNATRYLIESLIAPMGQVSKTILGSIAESEKKKIELQHTNATGKDLRAKVMMTKTVPVAHRSKNPITACIHIECVKKVAGRGQTPATQSMYQRDETEHHPEEGTEVIYKSLCHNPCGLEEIKAYAPGTEGLANCTAFYKNHGVCTVCKHKVEHHQHILVWYSETTETHEDPEVVRHIRENKNDANVKSAALMALDRQIAEFQDEHRMIQECAAKFTMYMKKNSITVYNDAALEYLQHLIKEENVKVQVSGCEDKRLEALKKELKDYQAYINAINEAKNRGDPDAVPDEQGVNVLVQQLYSMKHYGHELRQVADVVSRAYAATFRETPYHIRSKHYRARNQGHASRDASDGNHRSHSNMLPSMLHMGRSKPAPLPSRRQDGPSDNFVDYHGNGYQDELPNRNLKKPMGYEPVKKPYPTSDDILYTGENNSSSSSAPVETAPKKRQTLADNIRRKKADSEKQAPLPTVGGSSYASSSEKQAPMSTVDDNSYAGGSEKQAPLPPIDEAPPPYTDMPPVLYPSAENVPAAAAQKTGVRGFMKKFGRKK